MSQYDEAYDIVVSMARVKMTLNAHKGKIENIPSGQIAALCMAEVQELDVSLQDGDVIKIIEEAGDVLNFAVAAVQQALITYRSRGK